MNYYRWESTKGSIGNVYAESKEDAIKKVQNAFDEKDITVEILYENVKRNEFTGVNY